MTGNATPTTALSMKAMPEPMMVAARTKFLVRSSHGLSAGVDAITASSQGPVRPFISSTASLETHLPDRSRIAVH